MRSRRTQESKPVLDEVAQFTNRCKAIRVEISGHTDTDGGKSFNQDLLSERRARAVAAALIDKGLGKDRLTTVGFGYSRPVAENKTEEGKAENRRIEFNRKNKSMFGLVGIKLAISNDHALELRGLKACRVLIRQ
ncbi:MAG TPA: OmpA family protein [Hyphomicrobiaceae bacterium]|nr:OmpA family protein [Hyphomicrobiaceae bacterium]